MGESIPSRVSLSDVRAEPFEFGRGWSVEETSAIIITPRRQHDLGYDARVHHFTRDSVDHLRTADFRQAAVILASPLVKAANAERPLPRRALPSAPDGYRPAS